MGTDIITIIMIIIIIVSMLMPVNRIVLHIQEYCLALTDRGIPLAEVTQILVLRLGYYDSGTRYLLAITFY
jgi:hypothetical protein